MPRRRADVSMTTRCLRSARHDVPRRADVTMTRCLRRARRLLLVAAVVACVAAVASLVVSPVAATDAAGVVAGSPTVTQKKTAVRRDTGACVRVFGVMYGTQHLLGCSFGTNYVF